MSTIHSYSIPVLTTRAVGARKGKIDKGLNASSSEHLAAALKTLNLPAEAVLHSMILPSALENTDLAYLTILHSEPELHMLPTCTQR